MSRTERDAGPPVSATVLAQDKVAGSLQETEVALRAGRCRPDRSEHQVLSWPRKPGLVKRKRSDLLQLAREVARAYSRAEEADGREGPAGLMEDGRLARQLDERPARTASRV